MADAAQLLAHIRTELAPIEERLIHHPYLAALEQGGIPAERLSTFVGEQHATIESDLRSCAALVSRCDSPRGRRLFLAVLSGEDSAFGLLHVLASALGLDEAWLQAYEPAPEASAYAHYASWLAHYGSPAEVAAGMAVNFPAWAANKRRMGAALRDRYGLSGEATEFFDQVAVLTSGEFEEAVRRVVEDGLQSGVPEAKIKRAARLLQSYEVMFWDGVYRGSTA